MFKEAFKRYKCKLPTSRDLDEIIDFDCYTSDIENQLPHSLVKSIPVDNDNLELQLPLGLQPPHTWRCYALTAHPGLLVIRNPFTVHGQRYWIARSLRDYPRAPNLVNLNESLFTSDAIADWWRELQQCKDQDEARRLKISMRWATLGYHHNWDTKVYEEVRHTTFPHDLSNLCQYFANILGYAVFDAQAAIINYYPIGTTLSGHTDHSEPNHSAPLFSFSFGQTAIFLIGGTTREERPSALYLRSGDVLIMSQQSRLCYHAVPRVMKARKEPWNEPIIAMSNKINNSSSPLLQPMKKLRRDLDINDDDNDDVNNVNNGSGGGGGGQSYDMSLYRQLSDEHFWLPFRKYLNDSRINMNVRQVLQPGETELPS